MEIKHHMKCSQHTQQVRYALHANWLLQGWWSWIPEDDRTYYWYCIFLIFELGQHLSFPNCSFSLNQVLGTARMVKQNRHIKEPEGIIISSLKDDIK